MNFQDEQFDSEREAGLQGKLQDIYSDLTKKRDEWVEARYASGVERRWRVAQNLYDGSEADSSQSALEHVLRNGPSRTAKTKQRRSRVVVNIVAPKVEVVTARLCEILLPVDDRNWGIKPTPDPEMAQDARSEGVLVDQNGNDVMPLADAARGAMEGAKRAAEGMQREIDDALTECGYNGEQRRMIEDMVKLGTGVLKGPRPMKTSGSRYDRQGEQFTEVTVENISPTSVRVDPWNVYADPSCGSEHQRGSGIFERSEVTRRELRRLMDIPGYDAEAIAEALNEEPRTVSCAEGKVARSANKSGAYEMWEYCGEIEAKDFEFLRAHSGASPLQMAAAVVSGVLVMVNDKVIGALPAWFKDDLPYDFATYTKRDDSPFGDGLPHRLESQQRVVTAAWRQLMDNAGIASGGQFVMSRNSVEPVDGDWQVSPLKFWWAKEDLDDVRKAFTVFEVSSHVEELLAIVDAAMKMADQESNTPLIMQGDQGSAPDNVGGTTMLFNAANSPLRYRVKRFDDNVTRPHIKRYYDWMMKHSEKPEIKGDFEIDARGSSVLVERDAQNIAVMNMANLAANPLYGPLIQMKAASSLRAIVKAQRLPVEDWVPEDEEIEAAQKAAAQAPPPADPRIEAANIAAQSKAAEIADRKEDREFRAEVEANNAQERAAQINYNASREQGEFEIAMTQEQNERDIAFAKLASEREMSVEQLMHEWKIKTLDIDMKRQLFNAEAQLKVNQGSGI